MNSYIPTIHPSRSTGFSLVELLLAVALGIFLIGGVILIQSSSRAASLEGERLSRVQESVRFNSDFLVREMRNAGFRDQLSLTIAEFNLIGNEFASVNADGDEVTIRYSGRGSCAEGFRVGSMLDSGIVTNRYFVQDGELRCEGTVVDEDGLISRRTVGLATGLQDIRFKFMCPAGSTITSDCTSCPLWVNGDDFDDERSILNETCYGIRIGLLLEPVGPDANPVPVELSAAFRNIVLGKMMWDAVPDLP
ncbi:MAG: hypothetical protein RQ741_10805 [Wenzhouxiangellaceae bacterium]|nr:hypothetical protein [Wenzhouxiangellaceae bacterium]